MLQPPKIVLSSNTTLADVEAKYSQTGEIPMQFLISHLQYISDHQLTISNLLSSEIHQLDCQGRKNRAALINILSKQSSISAARLLDLNDCQSLVSHGSMALLYQCQLKNVTITSRKTACGFEPAIGNGTLSLDGYTLVNPFVPCLHDGRFAQIAEKTYEFDQTVGDWTLTKESVDVSHSHLAALFDITADRTASEGVVNFHERKDHSLLDMFGELAAVMRTSGQESLSAVLNEHHQDEKQTNNVPDVIGGIEAIFTGWRTTFVSVVVFLALTIGLLVTCRICGPAKILRACFPRRKKTPTAPTDNRDRPVIYRASNPHSVQFATGQRGDQQCTVEEYSSPLDALLDKKDRVRLAIENQAFGEPSTPPERRGMIRLGP